MCFYLIDKDIAWQVVHQSLPTRVFLKKKGIVQRVHNVQNLNVEKMSPSAIYFGLVNMLRRYGFLYENG